MLNETYAPQSTLNTSRLDDDQWGSISCEGSGTHVITLTVTTNTTNPADDAWVDDEFSSGWDGYTFELYVKSPEGVFSRIASLSPTSGMVNTHEQYMCPEYTYAV